MICARRTGGPTIRVLRIEDDEKVAESALSRIASRRRPG